MGLTIISDIPEGTCFPVELQDLLELFAAHLGGESGGNGGLLYVQTSAPTGVPEGTGWLEPVANTFRIYGRAPGDTDPSWRLAVPPVGTLTGSMLADSTVTEGKLSADVRSKLAAVAASISTSVLNLQEQTGGGSKEANFFVMSDGTLRVTGLNLASGKNGIGYVGGSDISILPKRCGFQYPLVFGDTVEKVYCMSSATYALTAGGTVYAAGEGNGGQLGLGSTSDKLVFTQLNGSYFDDSPVVQLAIGSGPGTCYTCYALTAAGKIFSWGHNYYGQLGLGGSVAGGTAQNIPQEVTTLGTDNAEVVVAGAGTGDDNTCKVAVYVRKTTGTVYGCGWNGDGNLGQGGTTPISTFALIGYITNCTHIAAAGANGHVTFYASTASGGDGKVWSCGYNGSGQVGDNTLVNKTAATEVLTLTGLTVTQLCPFATGTEGSMWAVLSDGTLRAWGSNANKQLGLGSGAGTADQKTPATPTVQDFALTPLYVERVVAGGSDSLISSAVLTRIASGFDPVNPRYHVFVAGANDNGNLGRGSTADQAEYEIALLDSTAIADIGFGASHSGTGLGNMANLLVRLQNGSVLACGYDDNGQMGVDSSPHSSSVLAYLNF